jgi:malonate decarboxylase epsilon subunit
MSLALLFAGQGAQRPGFLHGLPAHPVVQATLSEAGALLGGGLDTLDDAAALESTVATQLTVVVAGVAMCRALASEGAVPSAVAGLSVGAFAAAVASGVISFGAALQLTRLRAQAMAAAAPAGFGMAAVLGLSEPEVRALVAEVARQAPLYVASLNAPAETVIAGSDAALAHAARAAQVRGAALQRLKVAVPSHCPLMDAVSARLAAAFEGLELADPRIPYVSNHRARIATRAADVAEDLIVNVSRCVRWHDSLTLLYELGCRLYVETPPGQVLTQLVRASFPEARALALEDTALASVVTLAQRAR